MIRFAGSDIMTIYELLLRIAGSWTIYRDELMRLYGYDSIQIPKYPRKEGRDHITRGDKAVLPV